MVAGDQLLPVSVGVFDIVRALGNGGQQIDQVLYGGLIEGPVQSPGVVEADTHPPGAHGGCQLADQVPAGGVCFFVGIGVAAGP